MITLFSPMKLGAFIELLTKQGTFIGWKIIFWKNNHILNHLMSWVVLE